MRTSLSKICGLSENTTWKSCCRRSCSYVAVTPSAGLTDLVGPSSVWWGLHSSHIFFSEFPHYIFKGWLKWWDLLYPNASRWLWSTQTMLSTTENNAYDTAGWTGTHNTKHVINSVSNTAMLAALNATPHTSIGTNFTALTNPFYVYQTSRLTTVLSGYCLL